MSNAKAQGTNILRGIQTVSDKILGNGRSCLLETPNGFYIEIFERSQ